MKTTGIISSVFCIIYSVLFNIIYPIQIYRLLGGSTDVGIFGERYLPRLAELLENVHLSFINVGVLDKFLGLGLLLSSLIGAVIIFIPETRIGQKKYVIATICGIVLLSITVFSFFLINIYGPNLGP